MVQRKNVSSLGTFTWQAVNEFDEYNLKAEQYNFSGFSTISPELKTTRLKKMTRSCGNQKLRPKNLNLESTRNKAITISDNSDGGRRSDGRLKSIILGSVKTRVRAS